MVEIKMFSDKGLLRYELSKKLELEKLYRSMTGMQTRTQTRTRMSEGTAIALLVLRTGELIKNKNNRNVI